MPELMSSGDVARTAGVDTHTILDWEKAGLIVPGFRPNPEVARSHRRWHWRDVRTSLEKIEANRTR